MKKFSLRIVTPKGIYRDIEVEMLNLRTTSGQMGILAGHIPLASGIEISEMNILVDGNRTHFAIAGGFVYVNDSETTIIANGIESQDEIDEERATNAKLRASERLSQAKDKVDLERAEFALKKALNRINVKKI